MLLLTALNSYSDDIAPADADYCIDWIGDEKNFNAKFNIFDQHGSLVYRYDSGLVGWYSDNDLDKVFLYSVSVDGPKIVRKINGVDTIIWGQTITKIYPLYKKPY
jgi:hypothetical protein